MTLPRLSARAAALSPSPTLSISARANAMKAAGEDVIGLAAGEPDFDTPEAICHAGIAALESGQTRYAPTSGLPKLKELAAEKLWRENGVRAEPDQIVVSCGAKHSLYNAMMVIVDPGDEVILLAPYWMTYAEQVRLAGGIPVEVRCPAEDGFVPAPETIKAAITGRTKAIVLNTPCNPTGAVFPRSVIKEIVAIALRHGLYIISDEIYEKLVYDGEAHVSPASLGEEARAQTVTIQGCSKSFAMTGWRIGYACAPRDIAKAMSNLQDQVTSNATTFAQHGAIAALQLDPAEVERMRSTFASRRDKIVQCLHEIPHLKIGVPKGAFYALPDISYYLGGEIADDAALASFLLDKVRVATVPGSVFGGAGHLRLSYATSEQNIERAVARIGEALVALRT